jgi:hypothetical protein
LLPWRTCVIAIHRTEIIVCYIFIVNSYDLITVDGQVKHFDITSESTDNHVVIALPIQLKNETNSAWRPVGTSVVAGEFEWARAPNINLDLCKVL